MNIKVAEEAVALDVIEYSGNRAEWDEYVLSSEATTVYHQIGWKHVIEKTFGHRSFYLMAMENGEIKGILPLFLIKSRIFGSSLVSLPFVDYGGVVAERQEVAERLIDAAVGIAQENKIDYLELRHIKRIEDERLLARTTKVSFILPLNRDPEVLWNEVLHQNKRNKIRKANKYLSVYFGKSQEDILKCYKVICKGMRDLGAPTYPVQFIENIVNVFQNGAIILLTTLKDQVVGAKIALLFKDTMTFLLHYSLREFYKYAPNDLLYWAAIKYACENGYKFCDLGRCTVNSGAFKFKQKSGAHKKQLYWQYYLNGVNEIPELSSSSKKYRLAVSIWKRLPLFITEMIGPRIVKNIP